jgi:hypothetical protein
MLYAPKVEAMGNNNNNKCSFMAHIIVVLIYPVILLHQFYWKTHALSAEFI